MRIALISPYSCGPARGNITTITRIAHFLGLTGVETLILAIDTLSADQMQQRLAEFRAHCIHGFHACLCGPVTRQLATRLHVPYLITLTGSDVHDPQLRKNKDIIKAVTAAQAVICFDRSDAAVLASCFGGVAERISVIPQGVEPLSIMSGETFGLADDFFVLLLPAALRPVKQIEFPLQALEALANRLPQLRLVIAGGAIDGDYAATIQSMLCKAPYARWLGEIPHDQMGSLYQRADLILNCSRSESMPNSLMEAMALGRPVLAADIPGNRSLIRHGETGWLYRSGADFSDRVLQLAEHAELRTACGQRGREYVLAHHSPRHEAERLLALYRRAG
jgi:glycosyltransferase involved in cell wall biosynthesis